MPEDPQSILPLLEQAQASSDSYLVLEHYYHLFEDKLGRDEYTLSKLEQKLSSTLKRLSTTIDSNDGGYLPSQSSSTSSIATSYEYPLSDLDRERFEIEEQERLRFGLNIPREFLVDYDKRQSEIQAELDTTKEDIIRLYTKCKEEGIFGHDQGGDQGGDQDVCFSLVELKNMSQENNNSPFFEPNSSQNVNTTEFINKWILHRLRHSAMEILQLKSNPTLQELSQGGRDLQVSFSRQVLNRWFKDDAVAIPPPQTTSASDSEYHILPMTEKTLHRFSERGRMGPSFSFIGNPRPKSS